MIEKILDLVDLNYLLQNNETKLIKYLFYKFAFVKINFNKV